MLTNQDIPKSDNILSASGFIQGDTNAAIVNLAQVDFPQLSSSNNLSRMLTSGQSQSVKPVIIDRRLVVLSQTRRQHIGQHMHTMGNSLEPFWTMIYRIHASDYGQQYLGCTNIGCSFLPTNMLLTRLQSQPVSGLTIRVLGHTDQTARQVALVSLSGGHIASMRATKAQWHTKALSGTNGSIGTQ